MSQTDAVSGLAQADTNAIECPACKLRWNVTKIMNETIFEDLLTIL